MRTERVVVVGGDACADPALVARVLDRLRHRAEQRQHRLMILHGSGLGVDAETEAWCARHRVTAVCVRTQWERYGEAATRMRNRAMLDPRPDLVVVFPGSEAATQLAQSAARAFIAVMEVKAPDAAATAGEG
jgi:hypothetical protein